jgi:hypothetical protein
MKTRQTFFLFFVLLTVNVNAQLLSFDKSTAIPNYPAIRNSVYCANGDLVAVFTGSANVPNAFSVIRYDENGEISWQSDYLNSSTSSCNANNVIEAANGDLIISFSGVKSNMTSVVSGLLRLNSQGSILWERLYSTGSFLSDVFTASSKLTEATDGSIYLALSDINVSGNPNTEALILLRFSSSGNLTWGKGFGPTPPMSVVKLLKSSAGGVYIGANNNINPVIHLIRVDSTGLVSSSVKFQQVGAMTDFATDQSNRLKAVLTTDYLNWTRIIELDSIGNVVTANEASLTTSWTGAKLMWINGGYVTLHQSSGLGTSLCSWGASPSVNNGISFVNSSMFVANDFFEGSDGSIYMAGIAAGDPQTSKTRIIKTKPLLGNNFPTDGCSQTSVDFTIVSIAISNPIVQTLSPSFYTPTTEASSFQVQAVSASVINNCSLVSIDETEQAGFDVYPNPASDNIHISGSFSGDVTVEIYSVTGEMIVHTRMQPEGNNLKLNTGSLAEGVYMLRVIDGTNVWGTRRFVINR